MKKISIGEILKLDDEIDYVVMDRINHNHKNYILFTNLDNPEDIMIRIELVENNELQLAGLEDEEEFKLALELFNERLSIS